MKTWQQVAAFGLTLALGAAAHAQDTRMWIGPIGDGSGDGSFDTGTNWSDSNRPDTFTEIADTNATHNNIITLNVQGARNVHSLLLRAGDTLQYDPLWTTRNLTIGSTANGGAFLNDGTIHMHQGVVDTATAPAKRLTLNAGATSLVNNGVINMEVLATATNVNAAVELNLNTLATTAVFENHGTINLIDSRNLGGANNAVRFQGAAGTSIENYGSMNIGNSDRTGIHSNGDYWQVSGSTVVGTSVGSSAYLRALNVHVTGGVLKGTGAIGGRGSDLATLTVSATGTIAPGASVGRLTLDANAAALNFTGGTYEWELGALSTANPGVDFDQIVMNSGNLAITGGALKPVFIGSASAPDLSNAFWQSTQSWTVINNTGAGTASGALTVDNSAWAAHGSFSTLVDGNDLLLNWAPIPEPASLSLLALGGLMMLRRGRMA